MALLLLLNGPPAVGKSTLARRFVGDRPLALLVEVDGLRATLGQWQGTERSKHLARTLAVALVEAHLEQGLDVVVPQYLGRPEFVEELAVLAARHRARFVEVLLVDGQQQVARRFRDRRDELERTGEVHPEVDVDLTDVDALAGDWLARLDELRRLRPATTVIPLGDGLDTAYAVLTALVDAPDPHESGVEARSPRWNAVCIDCRDAEELADFYRRLLGWEITARDQDWCQLADPHGGVGLNIQAEPWYETPVWPEQPGEQAKMLHLEVEVGDIEAAVERADGLGAREARHQPSDRDRTKLRVMLDPAGHPFCLWTA